MSEILRLRMRSLLAAEDVLETFQYMGAHFLCQTPSLNDLNSDLLASEHRSTMSLENLEVHVPHRIPHITQAPISSYLYTLRHVKPDHITYQWAVNTLHALIALHDIDPASDEHQATIITLVNRFRLASQALLKSEQGKKLLKYDKLYLWLWEQLPQSQISLEDFIKQLYQLEHSGTLDTFQFNLIRDLRRAYQYVLNLSPKKSGHANASPKKLEHYPLDDSDHLLMMQELPTSIPIRSLQYERLADHPDIQHAQIETEAVSPLCKQSKVLQMQSVQLMQQHIIRLQHRFGSSNHYPDLESIRLLISHCWNQYSTAQSKNKAYLIILLSFLTGNSTEEWLTVQSPKSSRLNQRQRLIQTEDGYVLRSKFTLFDPVHFPHKEALQNQITHFDLPLPNPLIRGLKRKPILEQLDISKALQQCREVLYIPSLTSKKLSTLLHSNIYHMTGNAQLADILTGIDANRSCSISYCSYPVYRLQREYVETVQKLSKRLGVFLHPQDHAQHFGSLKAPTPKTLMSIYAYLYAQVIQAKYRFDTIALYNHYNIWMWHILLLFTGARPVKDFPGLLKDIDLDQGWFWVSDKEIHGRHDDGRILPLCDFLKRELKSFKQYLRQNSTSLETQIENGAQHIEDIFESKKPLLSIFIDNQWRTLSPAIVAQFTEGMQLEQANWLRHTTRAYLTDRVEEPLILALFGHERNQQELGNRYSSLALNNYHTLAKTLDEMKEFFKIDGMSDEN
ncbi:hypothetical protein M1L59_01890 [Acinetobacter schindleri]|uniref:hypothetical protein n=1 Tax=Acinetobacter schindleri TaxID=108981 RepID=UPI00200A0623|nr:hypothetical protein [Acinetobacter schindleri]MCK8639475.1 hypothetical protein [Acinetobacter schindleri]